jgi:hypothetical protein
MKTGYLLTVLLAAAFVTSCIADDNRCGKGQVYITDVADGEKYYCYEDAGTADAGTEADAGGGEPEGSGLGESCYAADDCAGYEADFCAGNPGEEGYCSFQDCTVEPDSCPGEYSCCDFMTGDKFCVTPGDLDLMGSMCSV